MYPLRISSRMSLLPAAEVLLLSWLLLGARYKPAHVAGAMLAIVGSSILVLSDSRGGVGDGPQPLLGDGLVLVGAAIYALLNISEEHLLGMVALRAPHTKRWAHLIHP